MTEDDFVAAVRTAPADDTPRLAYADWLDDRGAAARAEFIRVQCDLAGLDEADPRRPALEDREHALLVEHEAAWLDPGAKAWNEWEFRRGFVEMVSANTTALPTEYTRFTAPRDLTVTGHGPILQSDDRRSDEIPLYPHAERVDFSGWDVSGPSADLVLTHRVWPRLHALNLSYRTGPTDPANVLARAEFLPRLRELNVGGPEFAVDAAALAGLAARAPIEDLMAFNLEYELADLQKVLAAFATTLLRLDVSMNPLTGSEVLFERPSQLETLDLSRTDLARHHLAKCLTAPGLHKLRRLTADEFRATERSLQSLADSAFWSRAESFRSSSGNLGTLVQEPFFRTPGPPRLRSFGLSGNALGPAGVRAVAAAPWAVGLTYLDLSNNGLDDGACRTLSDGALSHLRTLHLAWNAPSAANGRASADAAITDAGAVALADSRHLGALRILTVSATGIGDRGILALLGSANWSLSGLGAAGLNLTPAVVPALAPLPHLRRLTWLDLSRNPALAGTALMPLAESEYLSPLCELDVSGIDLDPTVHDAFKEKLGPRFSS